MMFPNDDWSGYLHYLFTPLETLYYALYGFFVSAAGISAFAAMVLLLGVTTHYLRDSARGKALHHSLLRLIRKCHGLKLGTFTRP